MKTGGKKRGEGGKPERRGKVLGGRIGGKKGKGRDGERKGEGAKRGERRRQWRSERVRRFRRVTEKGRGRGKRST